MLHPEPHRRMAMAASGSYLVCRGDVYADHLFAQDRLGVDAAESRAELCVLGQRLE